MAKDFKTALKSLINLNDVLISKMMNISEDIKSLEYELRRFNIFSNFKFRIPVEGIKIFWDRNLKRLMYESERQCEILLDASCSVRYAVYPYLVRFIEGITHETIKTFGLTKFSVKKDD